MRSKSFCLWQKTNYQNRRIVCLIFHIISFAFASFQLSSSAQTCVSCCRITPTKRYYAFYISNRIFLIFRRDKNEKTVCGCASNCLNAFVWHPFVNLYAHLTGFSLVSSCVAYVDEPHKQHTLRTYSDSNHPDIVGREFIQHTMTSYIIFIIILIRWKVETTRYLSAFCECFPSRVWGRGCVGSILLLEGSHGCRVNFSAFSSSHKVYSPCIKSFLSATSLLPLNFPTASSLFYFFYFRFFSAFTISLAHRRHTWCHMQSGFNANAQENTSRPHKLKLT